MIEYWMQGNDDISFKEGFECRCVVLVVQFFLSGCFGGHGLSRSDFEIEDLKMSSSPEQSHFIRLEINFK